MSTAAGAGYAMLSMMLSQSSQGRACKPAFHILDVGVAGCCQRVGSHFAALASLAADAQLSSLVRERLFKLRPWKAGGAGRSDKRGATKWASSMGQS